MSSYTLLSGNFELVCLRIFPFCLPPSIEGRGEGGGVAVELELSEYAELNLSSRGATDLLQFDQVDGQKF